MGLPVQSYAQGLPEIDLPPLPAPNALPAPSAGESDFPELPALPAEDDFSEFDALGAPEPRSGQMLPTIEVTGDPAEMEFPEPTLDAPSDVAEMEFPKPTVEPSAPNVLPGSQAVVEASSPPPLPDLASDDPFADPDFDALFNEDKKEPEVAGDTPPPLPDFPAPNLLPGSGDTPSLDLSGLPDLPDMGAPSIPGEEKGLEPIATTPKKTSKTASKPKKRSNFSYKVQKMPAPIYQRQYDRDNRHLPVAHYDTDIDYSVFRAAAHDDVNGLRALLNSGRRMNMRNAQGDTPLITAIRANAMKTTRLLVARGANLTVKNRYGQTAMDIARQQRNKEALTLLSPLIFAQN